ncbi:hypothetical protein RUM44_006772 [Polyplax serrata]|uniref:Fibronectin type-III domain-containing protein n=1 Tax=Polyplax serrata TaxID=468196 RepID=A0ABR1AJ04_POLSC
MHICRVRFKLEFIFFTICCVVFAVPEVELKCAGIESPFDILPKGDHIVENGTTLELFCRLNTSYPGGDKYHSSDLQFYTLDRRNKFILPNVTILNDTTIKVDLVNPPLGSTYYYCALNDTNDCLTNVQVGYKPQPVLNFQCTSINWERLYCHWTPPENPIKTEYRLKYSLTGRAGRIPHPCPNDLDIKNNTCIYDFETYPSYRQPYEYFSFEISGKNALGNYSKSYRFHHYAHVIPNKPENVTVVNKTIGSAVIGWNIPYPLFHFPPGLRLKIQYKNKWEDWVEVNIPYTERIYGKNYTYNITGLKYSHTPYDVRIYLKSFVAKAGPNDWSLPASITFMTPPTVPSVAPVTTQGCFDVVSSGNDTDVFIYWARIPEKYENGGNFTYNVICTKNNMKDCGPPLEKSMTYAKFPINNSLHSYTFTIYSVNEAGRSEDNSFVYVSQYESLIQPESFTKVAYDQGVFELSWKPVHHKDLSNYTIFWCKEDKDLPMPCKGYLDWVSVDKNTTSKNITMTDVTKFYKFAISANLIDGSSSGMVWSSCVIFHDKVLKKVDDFHISRVGSREVDVVWEIRCAQSSAFKGFAFYYCPVGFSPQDNSCTGNATEEITKLNGSQERNVTLTNLRPYTTYKLQISIISLDGSQQIQLGPRSVAKRFLTLEDAPSIPSNLVATSVTNTSVALQWDLPKERNGILQTYKLYVEYPGGEKKIKFDAQDLTDNSIISNYEVKDLVGFERYNFTLRVCTSLFKCSGYSNPVVVTTRIGTPGKMMKPQVSLVNPNMADVSWSLPSPPSGSLDYYQLAVEPDEDFEDSELFNVTGARAKLEFQSCKMKYKSEFRVRAINIDGDNFYFGPWSDPTEVICGASVWVESNVLINWISGTATILILTACIFYIVKKGWLQCRKMKDVEVKLPPGLQSQELEKDNQDYVHLERWPRSPEAVNGSVGTVLAPDEESLLDKKSDESMDITSFKMPIKNGGDSSGCSVGRESVSSSITSDTHISSDSGAEPDQCTMTSNAFESWSSQNGNGNNLRNPADREILNLSDLGDLDLSDTAIPRYTKVGFSNSSGKKSLPGKGYVTIASVKSVSPPQKSSSKEGINCSSSNNSVGDSFSSGFGSNEESLMGPRYVSLAHFKGQNVADTSGSLQSGGRSSPGKSPVLPHPSYASKMDEEKTEDSIEEDFSSNETETETIHEVPITKSLSVMPPYVSMADNSSAPLCAEKGAAEEEEEEDDDDEEDEEVEVDEDKKEDVKSVANVEEDAIEKGSKENVRLSLDLSDADLLKTVSERDSALVENKKKEQNGTFSNYIPHHLFGKEPVHT